MSLVRLVVVVGVTIPRSKLGKMHVHRTWLVMISVGLANATTIVSSLGRGPCSRSVAQRPIQLGISFYVVQLVIVSAITSIDVVMLCTTIKPTAWQSRLLLVVGLIRL